MAIETSNLWKELLRTAGTEKEYQFDIDGIIYGSSAEISHHVTNGLFDDMGIGNARTATLSLTLVADSIPRGATIKRYVRLRNGESVSEWIPKGVFFANRRSEDDGIWEIEAYDAMRKAEQVWVPDQSLVFPLPVPAAVSEIVRIIGVNIDSRTTLDPSYTIDYPANEDTLRDELCYIAAAHAGNWIMTDAGELYLVPLISAPPETNYLVSEFGDVITFGGVRILV